MMLFARFAAAVLLLILSPLAHGAMEVIVDDAQSSATFTGVWQSAASATGAYGTSYVFSLTEATESATATWTPPLPVGGTYDVFVWYREGANRPTNARFIVHHSGGDTVVPVNQEINGSQWVSLGNYNMPATGGYVRLSNQSTETGQAAVADAVRFVPTGTTVDPLGDKYQGVWVYGHGVVGDQTSCLSADDTTTIVEYCRKNNINSLFVQVRRFGDALYRSDTEPKFTNVDPAYTDPLSDILAKAHDTSNGKQRIDVHAWIVPYRVWSSETSDPADTSHVVVRHPEWKGRKASGTTTSMYLDPGVPEVTDYLADVATELVSNYPELDGVHWDYFRYAGTEYGYNPTAIARFQSLYSRADIPATNDAQFAEFRREQIRQMGRKVYTKIKALRWNCKVSAATVTWSPNRVLHPDFTWADPDFTKTRPYYDVFSDWPNFMSEGLLDLNVPMAYFRDHDTTQYEDFRGWANFMAANKGGRHAVCGPAIYLNYVPNSMVQINYALGISGMDGMNPYVHHQTDILKKAWDIFWDQARAHTLFGQRRDVPAAPWISSPTQGILCGTVRDRDGNVIDGATVTISGGPTNGTLKTDGTGFYSFLKVDPSAAYSITVTAPGHGPITKTVSVIAGTVIDLDFSCPVIVSQFDME